MSLKIDRAELEIVIKNDSSRKRMREIEDDMRRIRKEMKGLDENSPQFQGKLAELKKAQAEYDKLVDKIGIAGLSMKELRNRQRELNAVLAQLPGDSPLYEKYRKQLDQVNNRMKELRGTAKSTEGSLSKLANGFNKYFAMGASFIAGITGASMAFRRLAEDVAKMDDVYSDVMKTTGMTRDEVLELNEVFKKIDTRTSREELNLLGRDAGKLGISGRKNILDFVDAGNQIRVALGEDLGEDAIKNIGKMVGVFKESSNELQGLDLKGQMLSVGSAVNELGASSTANEKYLVEFAGRLGGVAKQAGISMSSILGFASSLDQDMQAVEMSATALQRFIMSIMSEPAKFAKIAGMEVKQFTELLKTDANQAITTVLRKLNEKGGFQQLLPIFKDMGLDGARAVGVLSSLAGSIDQVEEAQKIANKAMLDGVSITNEYDIKNSNMQAQLDKARKAFKETSLELGEKLNPILLTSTKGMTYLIKALVEFPKWLKENKGLIITLASTMIVYTAVVNKARIENMLLIASEKLRLFWSKAVIAGTQLQIAVTGYLTGATKTANLATKAFFSTLKLNPYVAVGVVLAAAVVALYKLATGTKKVTAEQKALMDVTASSNAELEKETFNLEAYRKRLLQTEPSSKERIRLVKELNDRYPDLLSNIDAEKASVSALDLVMKDYMKNLENNIRLKVLYAKITDKISELEGEKDYSKRTELKKQIDFLKEEYEYQMLVNAYGEENAKLVSQQQDLLQKESALKVVSNTLSFEEYSKVWKQKNEQNMILFKSQQAESDALNEAYSKYVDDNQRNEAKLKQVQTSLKKIDQIIKDGNKPSGTNKTTNSTGGVTDDETKEKIKELDRQLADETLKLKQNYTTREKFEEDLQALSIKFIKKKRDLYVKDSAEWIAYEIQLEDIRLKNLKDQNEMELESIQNSNKTILESLDIFENEKRQKLQEDYDDGLIDKERYESELAALEIVLAEKRLQNAKTYLDLISQATFDSEEEKKKAVDDASKSVIAAETAVVAANAKALKLKKKQETDHQNEVAQIRKELGLDREILSYKQGLAALKAKLKEAEASEKETADAINEYKMGKIAEYADEAAKLASQVYNAVSGFERAALTKTEIKYQKQIDAARKAGQDTTELEEQKEQELAQVRAKYADAKFVLQIAQIGAETARAAIISYAEGMALGGPILAVALAGATTLYGLSQVALAKSERDAAKAGYKSGGYTGTGYSDDEVAGDVHMNEFVVQAKGVRNPHVRKFLDVFNNAQLNGTIHMLNTTQILERVRTEPVSPGYKSGGYVQDNNGSDNTDLLISVMGRMISVTDRLSKRLDEGIEANAVISGRNGVHEQTQRYLKYIKNASRP